MKKSYIITGIIVLALIAVGLVYTFQFEKGKQSADQPLALNVTPPSDIVFDAGPESLGLPMDGPPNASETPPDLPPVDDFWSSSTKIYDDAGVYINSRYKYSFSYPARTIVKKEFPYMMDPSESDAGVTFESLAKKYGDDLCVWVKLPLGGTVAIAAKENYEAKYLHCGRTGVGSPLVTDIKQDLEIAGQKYSMSGMKIAGDGGVGDGTDTTTSYDFYFTLPNKTRLYFEWQHAEGMTIELFERQRQEVLDLLASLRF